MLALTQVSLAHGTTTVVDGLSLKLPRGDIGCLLGPSGCGKITLLRSVAGFERLQSGRIDFEGDALSAPGLYVPPQRRGFGIVFQDHTLFPHLRVDGNVGFGLGALGFAHRRARVQEMLSLVGLGGLGSRWPHELSGGQQQRVALARALAPRPRLLLLDELFSNLDAGLRAGLAREVQAILKHEATTALMVTHDRQEAFAMADHVGVMANGRLAQWASADTVYRQPADAQTALFVGEGSLLHAWREGPLWHTAMGPLPKGSPVYEHDGGPKALLRPEWLRIAAPGGTRARVKERVLRPRSPVHPCAARRANAARARHGRAGAASRHRHRGGPVSFGLRCTR